MSVKYIQHILVVTLCISVFSINGCEKRPDITKLSPKQIIMLYFKSKDAGDTATLAKIIYFTHSATDDQRQARLKSEETGSDQKVVMGMVGAAIKPEYEKIIDGNTAEVGVVIRGGFGFGKRIPFQQIILTRDEGVWKYHYSMCDLTQEQLEMAIRKNPKEASSYYLFGRNIQPDNPPRAHRFFLRYYELEPQGFWVDDYFVQQINEFKLEYADAKGYETKVLTEIQGLPESMEAMKIKRYVNLSQLFMEKRDYDKATIYLNKSDDLLKSCPYPLEHERVNKHRAELQLRIDGKYHDILDESEKSSQ